jgi:hypothetical protein
VRLEQLGEGLAVNSGETVVVHLVDVLATEASTSGSSGAVLGSSVAASRTENADHASAGEPYSGF